MMAATGLGNGSDSSRRESLNWDLRNTQRKKEQDFEFSNQPSLYSKNNGPGKKHKDKIGHDIDDLEKVPKSSLEYWR